MMIMQEVEDGRNMANTRIHKKRNKQSNKEGCLAKKSKKQQILKNTAQLSFKAWLYPTGLQGYALKKLFQNLWVPKRFDGLQKLTETEHRHPRLQPEQITMSCTQKLNRWCAQTGQTPARTDLYDLQLDTEQQLTTDMQTPARNHCQGTNFPNFSMHFHAKSLRGHNFSNILKVSLEFLRVS